MPRCWPARESQVSTGAACSAGSHAPSHVLKAMNIPLAVELGAVRFSLSRETDDDDIDRALTATLEIMARLRKPSSGGPIAAVPSAQSAYA